MQGYNGRRMSGINQHGSDRTLRTLLDERAPDRLPAREVVVLFRAMLGELERLHETGSLHHDIRPETIGLLGVSVCFLDPATAHDSPPGGPTWRAPELEAGAPVVDTRVDIYSLGVVLWEMLSAPHPPIAGRIGIEQLLALKQHNLRQGLLDVMEAMVRPEREERLRTCEEVWQSLSWALDDSFDDELASTNRSAAPVGGPMALAPIASFSGPAPPPSSATLSAAGEVADVGPAVSSLADGPRATDAPHAHQDVDEDEPDASHDHQDAGEDEPGRPRARKRWLPLLLAAGVLTAMLVAWGVCAAGPRGQADREAEPPPEKPASDADLDTLPPGMPTLEDFGYFLQRLSEREKSNALNTLSDLASDSRLDPGEVAGVLRTLLDEGSPPDGYGYGCGTCFLRRLSDLLAPLRMQGPRVNPPLEGTVAIRLEDKFLKRLDREMSAQVGDSLPGLVSALLEGLELAGSFRGSSYVRYHGRGVDTDKEPAFFTSVEALEAYERSLTEPLDAWSLSTWLCTRPPTNRFEAGYLLLYFKPERSCTQVRIPTAADSENPDFRPTPASEKHHGLTCGGAPEWVCPNIPLQEFTRVRYVPNSRYIEGIR